MLAHKTSFVTAPASHALRWVFVWTALILATVVVVLLVSRHPSLKEKPVSDKGALSSISSLKVDAYRQHKPLGSVFSTPQNNPEAVLATAHDSQQLPQVP